MCLASSTVSHPFAGCRIESTIALASVDSLASVVALAFVITLEVPTEHIAATFASVDHSEANYMVYSCDLPSSVHLVVAHQDHKQMMAFCLST